jgi:hypothetical protein
VVVTVDVLVGAVSVLVDVVTGVVVVVTVDVLVGAVSVLVVVVVVVPEELVPPVIVVVVVVVVVELPLVPTTTWPLKSTATHSSAEAHDTPSSS